MKIKLSKAGFLGMIPKRGRTKGVLQGQSYSTIIYWAWWMIDLQNAPLTPQKNRGSV